ncbi:CLP1-like protein [Pyrus ussuriensis x Pyrus communis]|uniref:CLP1-like protein n=1 Tax=Pyrus ussuriensis x Pyrus communis TaxID=2448454 RepID=A0A5N5GFQ2_9ROSA|nr:CLP1-like protein [Pyrus ussuriensis x Pyrus communis]
MAHSGRQAGETGPRERAQDRSRLRRSSQVFTWNGATVEMEGRAETEYTADETPNIRTETPRLTLAAR